MRTIIFFVWLNLLFVGNAQLNPLSGRLGINGKVKLSKQLSLTAGVQVRSDLATLNYKSTNFTLDGSYRLSKSLKVGLTYRNLVQPNRHVLLDGKQHTYRNRFQLEFGITPSKWLNWDKFIDLDLRTLIQYEHYKFKRNQMIWRNKLTLKPNLKLKRVEPYLSAELFYRFNQSAYFIDNQLVTQGKLNELRYSLGAELKLSKNDAIDFGCMIRTFQQAKPTSPVLTLTYIHDFGRIKK